MIKAAKDAFQLVKTAGTAMSEDQATTMAAALAYYTVFSIAPLLVISIGIAGLIFGPGAGKRVFVEVRDFIGPQGASAIQSMVSAFENTPRKGLIAAAVGFVTLVIGASNVFTQLVTSLDIIWKVAVHPKATWRVFLRQRLLSFGMIVVLGFLSLVSLIVTSAIQAADAFFDIPGGAPFWLVMNFAASVLVIGMLFSAVFKVLPDVVLRWRDVARDGILTAVLFVAGKTLIGAYIGRFASASSYGAVGSLVVVLLWVYYSSLILFFGAELTRARMIRRGKEVRPKPGAVLAITPFNATARAINKIESSS